MTVEVVSSPDGAEVIVVVVPALVFAAVAVRTHWLLLLKRSPVPSPLRNCSRSWRNCSLHRRHWRLSGVFGIAND